MTVSIGVRDLVRSVDWYRTALGLAVPDLAPADGLVEFDLGPFWLQLARAPDRAGVGGVEVNISVEDVRALQARMLQSGLAVSAVERYEGAVDYCELTDPDGNRLGFVTELTEFCNHVDAEESQKQPAETSCPAPAPSLCGPRGVDRGCARSHACLAC